MRSEFRDFRTFPQKVVHKTFRMDWFNCFKIMHQQTYKYETNSLEPFRVPFEPLLEANNMILFNMNIKNIKVNNLICVFSLSGTPVCQILNFALKIFRERLDSAFENLCFPTN